jgi:hypothetical protein
MSLSVGDSKETLLHAGDQLSCPSCLLQIMAHDLAPCLGKRLRIVPDPALFDENPSFLPPQVLRAIMIWTSGHHPTELSGYKCLSSEEDQIPNLWKQEEHDDKINDQESLQICIYTCKGRQVCPTPRDHCIPSPSALCERCLSCLRVTLGPTAVKPAILCLNGKPGRRFFWVPRASCCTDDVRSFPDSTSS